MTPPDQVPPDQVPPDPATQQDQTVVIIGSGPAGLTAAIYAARANLNPVVVEGEPSSTSDQPGGQLMLTTDVENYPGFPEGVMGPDLMQMFRSQAERFGAQMVTDKVTKVDFSARPFGVWVGEAGTDTGGGADTDTPAEPTQAEPTQTEPTYKAEAVIVSTGAQSIMLGLDNEAELVGHGLSTCATCDGFFFRDQEIAVVGGGDSAMEEATFLTKFASKVTVIHRRDQLRASKIMQERAQANPKIEFLWNQVVTQYLGNGKLEGVRLRNTQDSSESELALGGLFIAIGHKPNTDLFAGQLDMKPSGYLITQPDSTATNIAGVFACGDVQDDTYRQAVTAAGSGCMAAIEAERWLEAQHG